MNSKSGLVATKLSQFDYTYDPDGEVKTWNSPTLEVNRSFLYDEANQLKKVTEGVAYADLGYDSAGNWIQTDAYTTGGGIPRTTFSSPNALNEIVSTGVLHFMKPLSYDANGNMTSNTDMLQTYEWDAANRLIAINYTDSGNRSEFSYDGMGRRVKITEYGPGVTAVVQPIDQNYTAFTSDAFTLPAGTYSLTFQGVNPNGGNNTALLDSVAVGATTVGNGGFETPSVTDFQVNPSNASWSFSGGAGIAGTCREWGHIHGRQSESPRWLASGICAKQWQRIAGFDCVGWDVHAQLSSRPTRQQQR